MNINPIGAVLKTKKRMKEDLKDLAASDPTTPLIVLDPLEGKFASQCGCCKRFYLTERGWQTHLPCIDEVDFTMPRTIKCPRCPRMFQEKGDLRRHLGDHPKPRA